MPEKYYCCYKTFNFSENFNVFFLSMVSIFNLGSLATKTYHQLKLLIQDGGKFIVTSISSRDDMSTQTIQSLIDLHLQLVFFFFVDKPSTCFLFCWQTFNLFSIFLTNLQLAFFFVVDKPSTASNICARRVEPHRPVFATIITWKIMFTKLKQN